MFGSDGATICAGITQQDFSLHYRYNELKYSLLQQLLLFTLFTNRLLTAVTVRLQLSLSRVSSQEGEVRKAFLLQETPLPLWVNLRCEYKLGYDLVCSLAMYMCSPNLVLCVVTAMHYRLMLLDSSYYESRINIWATQECDCQKFEMENRKYHTWQ